MPATRPRSSSLSTVEEADSRRSSNAKGNVVYELPVEHELVDSDVEEDSQLVWGFAQRSTDPYIKQRKQRGKYVFVKVSGCEGFHCYEDELLQRLKSVGVDLLAGLLFASQQQGARLTPETAAAEPLQYSTVDDSNNDNSVGAGSLKPVQVEVHTSTKQHRQWCSKALHATAATTAATPAHIHMQQLQQSSNERSNQISSMHGSKNTSVAPSDICATDGLEPRAQVECNWKQQKQQKQQQMQNPAAQQYLSTNHDGTDNPIDTSTVPAQQQQKNQQRHRHARGAAHSQQARNSTVVITAAVQRVQDRVADSCSSMDSVMPNGSDDAEHSQLAASAVAKASSHLLGTGRGQHDLPAQCITAATAELVLAQQQQQQQQKARRTWQGVR